MTIQNELDLFRSYAKSLARKLDITHTDALNIIAMQRRHPNWVALMKAWDKGWRPERHELMDANEESSLIESSIRGFDKVKTTQGNIAGEPYTLEVYFDEVLISGNGWGIHFGHAPSEPAEIEKLTSPNPLDDKAFFSQVMKIAVEAADGVREAITKDWGAAAMQPDKDGRAKHPLFKDVFSAEWFCLHCDGQSDSAQLVANMWHCPKCSATPIDIFAVPFWKSA
ncbi:hypothetical protein [Bradyrhizobium yuanmingense]|uniref:hypothetical protein n=1 Tax=Bradyrhizobium yuanmingense TaxID=108015 RepID=UPI0004B16E6E|nr:hypothetical protein [Bradyrhizobium yuanmingense]